MAFNSLVTSHLGGPRVGLQYDFLSAMNLPHRFRLKGPRGC